MKILDVTSASVKFRDYFSPMRLPRSESYKGYFCFENYWQSGKVFDGVNRDDQLRWWKNQKTGRRKYPLSKDAKVLYAQWDDKGDEHYEYVQSRKEVYVPQYHQLIQNNSKIQEFRRYLQEGQTVFVVDYDGPKNDDGENIVKEVSLELLREKINDIWSAFGHGYVVAAELLNITISHYIQPSF